MVWIKANGGPLALVVVGLALTGFTSDWGWLVVAAGAVWWIGVFILRRLPWTVTRKTPNDAETGASLSSNDADAEARKSKHGHWKPRSELLSDGTGLMIDLQNHFAPEITGPLACDVLSPQGGLPERLMMRAGMRQRVWCTYPNEFSGPLPAGGRLMFGTYEIRWYEATHDWEWVKFADDTVVVPQSATASDDSVAAEGDR